ncbi:hypothetical protein ACFDR8_003741 [Arthrobacter sp. MP_2.3]
MGRAFLCLKQCLVLLGTIMGTNQSTKPPPPPPPPPEARGWENVILLQADVVLLDPGAIAARIQKGGGAAVSDAALATYSLSLMGDWQQAWTNMTGLLAAHARVGVVDMQDPVGWARWLTPLARLACAVGGSDITAAPWQAVEERCVNVVRASARGGHLQIRAGKMKHDG